MQKQLVTMLLGMGIMGGTVAVPTPSFAAVAPAPQAQTIMVKGQVVDSDGEPLTGATIKLKGSSIGTVTDLDGNFQLNVPADAVLVVSYVGFTPSEVSVSGRTSLPVIRLNSDNQLLDQVVVVGYGTQRRPT